MGCNDSQCDHLIEHRKPDIVVLGKGDKKYVIVDVAIPGDKTIQWNLRITKLLGHIIFHYTEVFIKEKFF